MDRVWFRVIWRVFYAGAVISYAQRFDFILFFLPTLLISWDPPKKSGEWLCFFTSGSLGVSSPHQRPLILRVRLPVYLSRFRFLYIHVSAPVRGHRISPRKKCLAVNEKNTLGPKACQNLDSTVGIVKSIIWREPCEPSWNPLSRT